MSRIIKSINYAISFLLLAVMIFSTISCNKSDLPPISEQSKNTTEDVKPAVPWVLIVSAIVYVTVELSEGQATLIRDYYDNGKLKREYYKCSGLGRCALSMSIAGGEKLTTDSTDVEYDTTQSFEGMFALTTNNQIIFTVDQESEFYDYFFYGENISISVPYNINNPIFFEELGTTLSELIFGGEYQVYSHELGFKYIVLANL